MTVMMEVWSLVTEGEWDEQPWMGMGIKEESGSFHRMIVQYAAGPRVGRGTRGINGFSEGRSDRISVTTIPRCI